MGNEWYFDGPILVRESYHYVPGEVDLDLVIRAQSLAPHVTKRLTDLEICLWRLAELVAKIDPSNPLVLEAKFLLHGISEIPET